MKYATFTWTATVAVLPDFNEEDTPSVEAAMQDAWLQVQPSGGELTNVLDEPGGKSHPA